MTLINLATTPSVDMILAIFIAVSMPGSLYLTGFWVHVDRDDVRAVVRNSIFVLTAMLNALLIVVLCTDPTSIYSPQPSLFEQIGLAARYLGLNLVADLVTTPQHLFTTLGHELAYMTIGIVVVNLLFLGSLFRNIIEFVLSRNRQRIYAVSMLVYRQQQQQQQQQQQSHKPTNESQSINPALNRFPRYQVHSLWAVCQYELSHFTDHIHGATITPSSSLSAHLTATLRSYWQDCVQAFSLYQTSRSYTHARQAGQLIEYDRVTHLRCIFIVPVVEETIYRSTLYPFLIHYFTQTNPGTAVPPLTQTIFTSAIIFASCHLHHFFRHLNQHRSIPKALFIVTVQWIYCFLFALFGGYLYSIPLLFRTSATIASSQSSSLATTTPTTILFSLPTAIVSHMICNAYALPELDFFHDSRSILREFRWAILGAYFVGVVAFITTLIYLPTLLV